MARGWIADLVAPFDEHLQLVAGDRGKRQPVGERCAHAHQADGEMHCRPALAQRLPDALEELVPGDRVRPAQLEGLPGRCRSG